MHLINCCCDLLVIVFHLLILYDPITETIFFILLSLIDLQCHLLLKPEKRFAKCTRHKRLSGDVFRVQVSFFQILQIGALEPLKSAAEGILCFIFMKLGKYKHFQPLCGKNFVENHQLTYRKY
jgi:hypothetical protein